MIRTVRTELDDLKRYPELTTETARRRLLEAVIGRLRGLGWEKVPAYWRGIAQELVDHWAGVLEVEARRAREWLRLEVELPERNFVPGDRTLRLLVRNPTSEPAGGQDRAGANRGPDLGPPGGAVRPAGRG